MQAMQQMVDQAIEILSSPATDLVEFGRLLGEAWTLKRALSDRVSNATVDSLSRRRMRAGAIGGKLLGAGGGGFMLLFVRPEDQRSGSATRCGNLITVPFRFETSGSRIVLYQPDGLVDWVTRSAIHTKVRAFGGFDRLRGALARTGRSGRALSIDAAGSAASRKRSSGAITRIR